jgi:hypothetical protein
MKEQEPELNPIFNEDAPLPQRIEAFAMLKYSKERIAAALGYNKHERIKFFAKLEDETTEECAAYHKGLIIADAGIDYALTQAAIGGDNFCAAELLKRQDSQRVSELRKELFNL